jgi:hypothetical protein
MQETNEHAYFSESAPPFTLSLEQVKELFKRHCGDEVAKTVKLGVGKNQRLIYATCHAKDREKMIDQLGLHSFAVFINRSLKYKNEKTGIVRIEYACRRYRKAMGGDSGVCMEGDNGATNGGPQTGGSPEGNAGAAQTSPHTTSSPNGNLVQPNPVLILVAPLTAMPVQPVPLLIPVAPMTAMPVQPITLSRPMVPLTAMPVPPATLLILVALLRAMLVPPTTLLRAVAPLTAMPVRPVALLILVAPLTAMLVPPINLLKLAHLMALLKLVSQAPVNMAFRLMPHRSQGIVDNSSIVVAPLG